MRTCARVHACVCGLEGNGADCGKEARLMQWQDSRPPRDAGPWTSHKAYLEPRVFTAWEEMNQFN